jgi:hypothetical protein
VSTFHADAVPVASALVPFGSLPAKRAGNSAIAPVLTFDGLCVDARTLRPRCEWPAIPQLRIWEAETRNITYSDEAEGARLENNARAARRRGIP